MLRHGLNLICIKSAPNVASATFRCDVPYFVRRFAAVFTLTITNFTLIGHHLHYVNSSPLILKQYRFVSDFQHS